MHFCIVNQEETMKERIKDIRFGIIGCGDVTEKKSGPAFKKVQGSDLVMVMRRDEAKLIDYAKRHNILRYTTDYKELLEDEDVDAVYIATPPKWHHFYTLEAAKHKKAIYVEKPMAMTTEECKEMIDVCHEQGVPLYVAYYRRGQEKFKKVKELITSKAIGDIRGFHYCYSDSAPKYNHDRAWLMSKEEAGGGLLFDVGSHMMDIILYFFGDVETVYGTSKNQSRIYDVNDITTGCLNFKNGVQGSVQLTFNAANKEDILRIIGSQGYIELSIMSNEEIIVVKEKQKETISFEDLEHVQLPFIQMVVDHMHGINDLDNTGISALKTQEVLEALQK